MEREEGIRHNLEQVLGTQLREEQWNYLLQEGDIEGVRAGAKTISQLADKLRTLQRTFGQPIAEWEQDLVSMLSSGDIAQAVKEAPTRQIVLSRVLAVEAAKEKEVQEIRSSQEIGKFPKTWDEVEDWIQFMEKREGQIPSWWLDDILVPRDYQIQEIFTRTGSPPAPLEIPAKEVIEKARARELRYATPTSKTERQVLVTEGKFLDRLRLLSEDLAAKFGWTKAQSTIFVLTDLTPSISNLAGRTIPKNMPAATRIQLTIDPTISPEEVTEYYRKFRQDLVGLRHRELSPKHLMLALFVATRPEAESWTERMELWNKEHPGWPYQQEGNFGRDCRQARQRLLYPNFRFPWWRQEEEDLGEESER